MTLLVGAQAFWENARVDIAAAKRRVLVQAMSFEGDAAGLAVAEAIGASGAADRRVLVDDYTRINLNDRSVRAGAARRDTALMAEVAATDRMFRGLVAGGASVRVTNPIGRWGANYPARNHKKLLVADDVAYLGGVNFSDHNFLWPDLMLRLEGREAADFLTGDFEATFAGRAVPGCWQGEGEGLTLTSLDGRSNAAGFAPVLRLIAGAAREIIVISPYLSFPFTGALAAAARRGARVRLITPWPNNKPTVRNALLAAAARGGFEVRLAPGMSHLKAILIDDAALVVGSSNFDFVSLAAEEELLALVSDAALIADFKARVLEPARAETAPARPVGFVAGWASHLALKVADQVARASRRSPRTAVDWGD